MIQAKTSHDNGRAHANDHDTTSTLSTVLLITQGVMFLYLIYVSSVKLTVGAGGLKESREAVRIECVIVGFTFKVDLAAETVRVVLFSNTSECFAGDINTSPYQYRSASSTLHDQVQICESSWCDRSNAEGDFQRV